MTERISTVVRADILRSVQLASTSQGIVNVPLVAEEVRQRNLEENIALEDIERELLTQAERLRAAMEFDPNAAGLAP